MARKFYEIFKRIKIRKSMKKKLINWLFLKACEIPHLLMTSLTNISSLKEKKKLLITSLIRRKQEKKIDERSEKVNGT